VVQEKDCGLSRKSYPKQFCELIGNESLFQKCAQRLISTKVLEFQSHLTICNSAFCLIVSEQLGEVGIDPVNILLEPEAKNTAPAILEASIFKHAKNPDAVLLVAPSDHLIPHQRDFHKTIAAGLPHVAGGKIVTFGIEPNRPETAYGYLQISEVSLDNYGTGDVLNIC
jgi:mannose-1-phosphate guanylyltransferase / mannose-6-phosphate isomerase